jgi:hypothetical protein
MHGFLPSPFWLTPFHSMVFKSFQQLQNSNLKMAYWLSPKDPFLEINHLLTEIRDVNQLIKDFDDFFINQFLVFNFPQHTTTDGPL